MPIPTELVTSELLRDWALPRPSGSKHSRGQVLAIGGSPSTPGAVMLAGLAALRVGAGVLGLAVARSVATAVAVAVPESSVIGLPELDGEPSGDELRSRLSGCGVALLGPGIDDPDAAEQVVRTAVDAADDDTMFVLDAFALGVLPGFDSPQRCTARSVLTPNQAEADRLLDGVADDAEPTAVAVEIAHRYDAVVSYQRCIAAPSGRTWRVAAGHPGLGTSGSGDVLAGAVTGLLARGADRDQAACWATYLHAVAGERLAARVGRLGFLARELVEELPVVLTETEA